MRIMKIKCIHRLQRQNFVVSWKFVLLFHSRKFVLLLRDFSRENFRFVDLKMLYVNSSFNSRKFVLLLRDLSLRKLHTLTILFNYSRTSTSNLFRSKAFDRVSINFAEFKTKNRVQEAVNHRHCELRIFRAENDIVTNWSILFLSTRWSFDNECEIYIARHDKNQI